MSSILEALKKLEEEKAARRSGMGNLAGKVAKTGRQPRQTPAWLLPGGMLAVAIVSVLVTYVAMNGTSPRRSESVPGKKTSEVARTPDNPLPPVSSPVTDVLNSRQTDLSPQKKTEGISTSPPGTSIKAASPHPESTDRQTPSVSPTPAKNPPESAGAPFSTLNVSGIAWQKDNAFRMAVVNGVPVREGDTVEGITVKEILPDRIRFSVNGKEFEVPMEN